MTVTLPGTLRPALIALIGFLTVAAIAGAQSPRRTLPLKSEPRSIPPLADDAALHDVHFVGERRGWAVGDRGVIWRTDDGGRTWEPLASGVECALRSVCFLTDRVGWVAGGGIAPHVGASEGVLLATIDGGDTWKLLVDHQLPLLHTVQFFDLEQGMAVCESTARYSSGVLRTTDGGQTWEALPGTADEGWHTGAFVDEDMGYVAGRLGRFTSIGGGRVMPPRAGASGLRGIIDTALLSDGHGWLAGDGSLVLTTSDGGVSWRSPASELPRGVRDVMDFQAVAARGEHVWLAGVPGSVIWHSPDNGRTWTGAATGSPSPIAALHFSTDLNGCAVGALGCILVTSDGGRTWTPSRGGGRRAAILALHAHESRVSLNLVTKYGAEQGYRTAVTLISRRDVGPDGRDGRTLNLRLQDAVVAAGGVGASLDWAFPVAAPELDHHPRELIREWQLLTDNRLREVMLSRLIVQLRTWRPDVLVVDLPPPDDATTQLLADALKLAVSQAALNDELAKLLQLPPWRVQRAYQRLPAGSEGAVAIDAFEFLPRLGSSIAMSTANAVGILGTPSVTGTQRETYQLWPLEGLAKQPSGRDFFAGLVLQPGGDARRVLSAVQDDGLEERENLAHQQRNFAAYAARMLDDERRSAQLIGQTRDIIGSAPSAEAAIQLAQLADEYRRRGQWEHAQATLFSLVERYPDQPPAAAALQWLFHFTSSAEVSWQRQRASSGAQQSQVRVDENVVQAGANEAIRPARPGSSAADEQLQHRDTAIRQTRAEASLRLGSGTPQHAAQREQWQMQAVRLTQTLQRVNRGFYEQPEIQFPLAALERARKHPREADIIVNSFLSETADGAWNRVAAGEVWLTQPTTAPPGSVALCHRAPQAPWLDGELDDPCWQQALEIPLKSEAEHLRGSLAPQLHDADRAIVKLAYDRKFLYIAAQLPRRDGTAVDAVELPGRSDDADLSGHDRLSLQLDTDRDYATCYRFDVDQRGWTADACWDNEAWNARRFIAADADAHEWRLEMAIPFEELTPQPPQSGDTWAAGIVRVLPTVGIESWTSPAGTQPQPRGFGLLRFE